MSQIHMIRHGKPAAAWGGADGDPGLDETGWTQARHVARRLLALPDGERPSRVVSSPLRRCRETAAPFARAIGVVVEVDAAVGEIPTPAGLAGGRRPAWLRAALGGRWAQIEGDLDYDVWRRGVAAAATARPGAAVFSHFVAINAVLSVLTGDDRVVGFRPDHASITVLGGDEKGYFVVGRGREAATGVL